LIDRCSGTPDCGPTFGGLAASLGAPTEAGRRALVAALMRSRRSTLNRGWREQSRQLAERAGGSAFAVAACIFLLAAATSPLWRGKHKTPASDTSSALTKPAAIAPALVQQSPITDKDRTANSARRRDPEVRPASFQTDQPRPQPAARAEPK